VARLDELRDARCLFAVGFIFRITMGGFTGLILAIMPIDIQLQDTYYVVAHFTTCWSPVAVFAVSRGFYFWVTTWTAACTTRPSQMALLLSMIFFNVTFFPMHFLGLAACRAGFPTTHLQFAGSTRSPDRRVRFRAVGKSCFCGSP